MSSVGLGTGGLDMGLLAQKLAIGNRCDIDAASLKGVESEGINWGSTEMLRIGGQLETIFGNSENLEEYAIGIGLQNGDRGSDLMRAVSSLSEEQRKDLEGLVRNEIGKIIASGFATPEQVLEALEDPSEVQPMAAPRPPAVAAQPPAPAAADSPAPQSLEVAAQPLAPQPPAPEVQGVNGPQSDSRPTEGTKGVLDRIKDVFVEFFKKIFSEKPFKVNYGATAKVVKIFKNPIHVQVNDLSGQDVIKISERLEGEIRVVNAPEGNDSILWAAEMDRDVKNPLPTEGEDEEASIRNRVEERMGAIKAGLQKEIDMLRPKAESCSPSPGIDQGQIAKEIRSLQARMDGTAPLLPEDMRFVAKAAGRDIAIISKEGGKTVFHLCGEDGEYMHSDRLGAQSARKFGDEFCGALKNGQRIFVQDGRAGCLQGEIGERGYDDAMELEDTDFDPDILM